MSNIFKQIAINLPADAYGTKKQKTVTRADAESMGLENIPAGDDPEELLYLSEITEHKVNHERRMRRAYQKGGKVALIKYLGKYIRPGEESRVAQYIEAKL